MLIILIMPRNVFHVYGSKVPHMCMCMYVKNLSTEFYFVFCSPGQNNKNGKKAFCGFYIFDSALTKCAHTIFDQKIEVRVCADLRDCVPLTSLECSARDQQNSPSLSASAFCVWPASVRGRRRRRRA